jgi:hypothetical protein
MILILLMGCDKFGSDGLELKFRAIYTSEPNTGKQSAQGVPEKDAATDYYTQFGDFLGTLSPGKVTAQFNTIRFIDRKNTEPGMQTLLEIIGVNWPFDDERRFADFTNGNTIEFTPEIYGNVDNDGWFVDENIRLKYLLILPQEFLFEFDLPEAFTEVFLGTYPAGPFERVGNTIKSNADFFLFRLTDEGCDYEHGIKLNGFVFGETDTSYIVCQNNIAPDDVSELITQAQPHCVVRSDNYVSPVLTPPRQGEPKIITASVSFHSADIIQHYAGYDNIANTSDDVFIFEPNFWERFSVTIEQN